MCSIRKSCTRNSHPYNWSSPINVLLPDPVYLCLLQPLESKHFLARLWPCWLTASVVRHYRFWPCPQAQLSLALRLWTGLASRQTAPAVAGSLFLPGDLVPRPSTSAPASPSASTLALCFSNRVFSQKILFLGGYHLVFLGCMGHTPTSLKSVNFNGFSQIS